MSGNVMYMLGIEYIICTCRMASLCVAAISALHPSIAALGFGRLGLLSQGSGLVHTSKPCYIYYIYIYNECTKVQNPR